MDIKRIAIIGSESSIKDDAAEKLSAKLRLMGFALSEEDAATERAVVISTDADVADSDSYAGVFFVGSESLEENAALISLWTGHTHMRLIGDRYPEKSDRLILEVCSLLGEPEPFEIERKFLIKLPDMNYLESLCACCKVGISQTYLDYPDGSHARVRRRDNNGKCLYYHTVKMRISNTRRIEIERTLTREEYEGFLSDPAAKKRSIDKDRYCISYDSQYFELDVFPFWDDKALLEIELCSEDEEIRIPPEITVIKEVTDDRAYTNAALARIVK